MDIDIEILNDKLTITSNEKSEYFHDAHKYITSIFNIWHDVRTNNLSKEYANKYLQKYNDNGNNLLRAHDDALILLRSYFENYLGLLIDLLKLNKLEVLIAGSCGLSVVLKELNSAGQWCRGFIPNDIDLYIKDINNEKIKLLDNIIRNSVDNDEVAIILVRNPITITWHIFYRKTFKIFRLIQLNLLKINSWTDVFICYHSDMVCIGFDVLQNNLICLGERWNRFSDNIIFDWNKPHFFSNFLNIDTEMSIDNAASKYHSRGFRTEFINIKKKDVSGPFIETSCSRSVTLSNGNIFDHLLNGFSELTTIATDVSDLVINHSVPHLLELRYVPTIYKEFYEVSHLIKKSLFSQFNNNKLNDYVLYFKFKNVLRVGKRLWKEKCELYKKFINNVPYWIFYVLLLSLNIHMDDEKLIKYLNDAMINNIIASSHCFDELDLETNIRKIIFDQIKTIGQQILERKKYIDELLCDYVVKDIIGLIDHYIIC